MNDRDPKNKHPKNKQANTCIGSLDNKQDSKALPRDGPVRTVACNTNLNNPARPAGLDASFPTPECHGFFAAPSISHTLPLDTPNANHASMLQNHPKDKQAPGRLSRQARQRLFAVHFPWPLRHITLSCTRVGDREKKRETANIFTDVSFHIPHENTTVEKKQRTPKRPAREASTPSPARLSRRHHTIPACEHMARASKERPEQTKTNEQKAGIASQPGLCGSHPAGP